MKYRGVRMLALVSLLGVIAGGLQVTANPTPAQQTSPPPAKKPAEPIDPDATAGVRGPGYSVKVRVLLNGKPVYGAYVIAKNPNGSVAGTGNTNSVGECLLNVGEGDYGISATQNRKTGTASMHISASTGTIVIRLAKLKAADTVGKP